MSESTKQESGFKRFFDKFAKIMDEKFSTPMARLAEQKHLRAIRDGIIATLPIIIVSSVMLIVAFLYNLFPDCVLRDWWKANAGKMLLPYRMGMYIMSLYAVFGMGNSLAKSYKLDGLTGGILSTFTFMLTIYPQYVSLPSLGIDDYAIALSSVGTASIFVSILSMIFAVEIYRLTQRTGFKIRMPKAVPESVTKSFESLTPIAIIFFIVGPITMWLRFDIREIITIIIKPLIKGVDKWYIVLLICFLESFFWIFGIHGASVVFSLARPFWLVMLDANEQFVTTGKGVHYVTCEPFYQWFVDIGGSGCTIGLVILMVFFAKSKYMKAIGKTGIAPAIFNINEPIVFGAPIVLNPILIIPFILSPMINAMLSYIMVQIHFLNTVSVLAPWTLPGPVGSFFATGGDWKGAVWSCVLIILSVFIYLPFFKLYDKQLLEEESKQELELKQQEELDKEKKIIEKKVEEEL